MINIRESTFLFIYTLVLVFILGSVMGSFLNCVADRVVEHKPWWKGRSCCDSCGHQLGIMDLFPVFSYIFLKGKCRYCGTKLDIKYMLSELILGLVFVFITYALGYIDATLIYILILTCILYGLSLVDLKSYTIPDTFIILGIINYIIYSLFIGNNILNGIISGLIISGSVLLISLILDKILKKESMGGGDIKLLFMVGLNMNLLVNLFNLILSCIIGLIMIFITRKKMIPFGPSIALASIISILFGNVFISFYLSLFM